MESVCRDRQKEATFRFWVFPGCAWPSQKRAPREKAPKTPTSEDHKLAAHDKLLYCRALR